MDDGQRDEAALILRCREGDSDAIRKLVGLYEGPVFHLIWRLTGNVEDARDLTQETFVRTIRTLERFDLARPFRNWIFRIASNLAIDHLRRRRVRTISIDVEENDETQWRAPILVDPGERPDETHEHTWLSEGSPGSWRCSPKITEPSSTCGIANSFPTRRLPISSRFLSVPSRPASIGPTIGSATSGLALSPRAVRRKETSK